MLLFSEGSLDGNISEASTSTQSSSNESRPRGLPSAESERVIAIARSKLQATADAVFVRVVVAQSENDFAQMILLLTTSITVRSSSRLSLSPPLRLLQCASNSVS